MNTNIQAQPNHFAIPTDVDWTNPGQCANGVSALVDNAIALDIKSHEAKALAAIGIAIAIHLHGDNKPLIKLMNNLSASSDKVAIGQFFVERAKVLSGIDVDKLADKKAVFEAGDFPVLPVEQRCPDLLTSEADDVKNLVLSITGFDLSQVEKPKLVNAPDWAVLLRKELEKQLRIFYTRGDSEEAKPMPIDKLRAHIEHAVKLEVLTLSDVQDFISKTQSRAAAKGKLIPHDECVLARIEAPAATDTGTEPGVHVNSDGNSLTITDEGTPIPAS